MLCWVFVSFSKQFAKLTLAGAINVTAFGFAQKNHPEAVIGNHEVIISTYNSHTSDQENDLLND